jgi:hypothetical protein
MDKPKTVDRRSFLGALGVTVGGTGLAGAGLVARPQLVKAATAAALVKKVMCPVLKGAKKKFRVACCPCACPRDYRLA